MMLPACGDHALQPSPDVGDASTPPLCGHTTVEPWITLLLDGEAEEEEGAQDRKLAEVVPLDGGGEQDRAILQDVTRTRSGTPALSDKNVRRWLQQSVTLFCRERGLKYAQGLTELAAPWALITDPPCLNGFSYRCFASFVDRFAPNMFATAVDESRTPTSAGGRGTSLVVLEVHLVLLEHLLRFHDPVLASRMDKCCVSPAAYATPWFVTIFARQIPIPGLLHLWRRLAEYGDPALHQFLALALLVCHRRVLVEAPREDTPELVTRLRLRSIEEVDGVFGAAIALQASTPRLFCRVLRRACYGREAAMEGEADGGEEDGDAGEDAGATGVAAGVGRACTGGAAGTSAVETGAAGPGVAAGGGAASSAAGGSGKHDEGALGEGALTRTATEMQSRASFLRDLRAAGVLVVDANQVAEILVARHAALPVHATAAAAAVAAPRAAEVGREGGRRGAARPEGTFVLVDCRLPPEGTAALAGEASRDHAGAPGGRAVVWGRIHPATSFGREAAAVADALAELGVARLIETGNGGSGAGVVAGTCQQRAVDEVAVDAAVAAPYAGGDSEGDSSSAWPGMGSCDLEFSTVATAATHVCFIGSGRGSGGGVGAGVVGGGGYVGRGENLLRDGGDGRSYASTPAVVPEMTAPEFRLARAASRSCLVTRVCVLEGGFPALDAALSRRGAERTGAMHGSLAVGGTGPVIVTGCSHPMVGGGRGDTRTGGAAPATAAAAVTGGGGGGGGGRGGEGQSTWNPAGGEFSSASVSSETDPERAAQAAATECSVGGQEGGAPPRSSSQNEWERKAGGISGGGNSRVVSEPFRAYAAKSADEMGRALRSLPLAASKPLEDAARVCNSLARANARALGDSRLSLSRSVAQLDQLNARMDGTAGGFARYLGASGAPPPP